MSLPNLAAFKKEFVSASPFPNLVIDNFLDFDIARQLSGEFESINWQNYKHYSESKQGNLGKKFPAGITQVISELHSRHFLEQLEQMTGIQNLLPDVDLESGGLHRSGRGGYLKMHTDFTRHPTRSLERRLNLLLYLTQDWDPEWGGALELWDWKTKTMSSLIEPKFNRCVIFRTSDESLHGHPEPMRCPEGVWRQSIALYYYTNTNPSKVQGTKYFAGSKATGFARCMTLIDNIGLQVFHHMKKLGVSDRVVTWFMKLFSK